MYQSTKSLVDDLSRREVETSQYGDVDEAYRVYEDVFALGVWPNGLCSALEPCAECAAADED